jgi:hypothetical protein
MKSATKAQVWVHAKLERLRVQMMRDNPEGLGEEGYD